MAASFRFLRPLIDMRLARLGAGWIALLAVATISAVAAVSRDAARFIDPLNLPARMSVRAPISPLLSVARADATRLAAVGLRGHVLASEDNGRTWSQRQIPLSSDLLAVQFPTALEGWAVGHDGVVLRTKDAGLTWTRALDGRAAADILVGYLEARAKAGDASAAGLLDEARQQSSDGPTRPFLSVYFRTASEGWIVGQFNLILHTLNGGETWEPWLDRTENQDSLSLHSIQAAGDDVFIVGELGLMLKLEDQTQRFKRIPSPYPGSWFAAITRPGSIIAAGLRGNAWRSVDGGLHWTQLDTGTTAAINGGTYLKDGRLALVSQQGAVLVSHNNGDTFSAAIRANGLTSAYGVAELDERNVLVVGAQGVVRVALPQN